MIAFALPLDPATGRGLDLSCPVIVCDACGEIITADRPGVLLYEHERPRDQFHVHQGRCDREFSAGKPHHFSRELDSWLEQLARNYSEALNRPRDITLDSGATYRITRWVIS